MSKDIEEQTSSKVRAVPIRVMHGKHDGPNRGFGRAHIEAEHASDYAFVGFDAFVTDAITTFSEVYTQSDKIVVLFRTGKARLQAVLEFRGGFYSVVTVFRAHPKKEICGELIWKRGN